MARDLVQVAVLGAPHGVRGEIRVKALTQNPASVGDYGPVEAEDGRRFTLSVVRTLKDGMAVVRIAGVEDREAAAALTHLKLFVPRDRLPEPEEDEFYASDLVGLVVADRAGNTLGTVRGVADYGAGDLLDVQRPDGGSVLLPFTRAFVPEVDMAGGRLVAEPPAGLFDEEGQADAAPGPEGPRRSRRAHQDGSTASAAPGPGPATPPTRGGRRW
ncbi:MAG: ribosome maturation factor RimM [Alsobacter sp.]